MSLRAWYWAWQGRRWAALEARRFCRRSHLENWHELADERSAVFLVVPKEGLWRAITRALELFPPDPIELFDADLEPATAQAEKIAARLSAGAKVVYLGREERWRDAAIALATAASVKVCRVVGDLRVGELWIRLEPVKRE